MSEKLIVKDRLNYRVFPEIKSIIGDEKLLYSDRIIKLDKYNMSKEVNLLITSESIYLLKKTSIYIFYI